MNKLSFHCNGYQKSNFKGSRKSPKHDSQMPPMGEPFGTQNATNCLPERSPKIDQKAGAEKFENGANTGWGFGPPASSKSLKIEPWAKMVPQGCPKGVPSLKKPPKSCQQAPKSDKKSMQHADPNHHSTTQLSPKRAYFVNLVDLNDPVTS